MGKKKSQRNDDENWEDDIEALRQEMEGGPPKAAAADAAPAAGADDKAAEDKDDSKGGKGKKGKKGGKADKADDVDEEEPAAAKPAAKEAPKEADGKKGKKAAKQDTKKEEASEPAPAVAPAPAPTPAAAPAKATGKDKKKGSAEPAAPAPASAPASAPAPAAAVEPTPTPAPAASATPTSPTTPATPSSAAATADAGDDKDGDDDGDDGEGGEGGDKKDKKKKKKKPADKKEDKKDVKAAKVSKALAAIKEQVLARQREEERILAEIEAKKQALLKQKEEEERLAREEEERRAARKLRQHEKKEQLRREGKLLTKAEKEKKAMDEAKLAQMIAMGLTVPAVGTTSAKKPNYGKKKKTGAKAADASKDTPEPSKEGEGSSSEDEEQTPSTAAPHSATTADVPEDALADAPAAVAAAPAAAESDGDDTADDWETADWDSRLKVTAPAPAAAAAVAAPAAAAAPATEAAPVASEADSSAASVAVPTPVPAAAAAAVAPEASSAAAAVKEETKGPVREATPEEIRERIRLRQEKAKSERSTEILRSAIIAVLGHVDAGKTKLLDNIRRSNVQGGEAGGITQQIGATFVPREELMNRSKTVKKAQGFDLKLPGLLVIDTPGHESFHNLRSRGSSLCDLAVLVVDILSGLEKQTIESLEMLRDKRVPFVIALNKVDRLNEWVPAPNSAIQNSLKRQKQSTMQHFDTQLRMVQLQLAENGLNTILYWENKDERSYVNIIPTSAVSGEGLPDLLFMLASLPQKRLADKLSFSNELECTVLEVKVIAGHGCTVDAVLTQGTLHEGDTVVLSGLDGPICTTVRSLLMPQPLKEMRVKNEYETFPEVRAAQGLKIAAKDLESAVAGLPLVVAYNKDEIPILMEEAAARLKSSLNAIKLANSGIAVQASTLGSLEAMLDFLKGEKIPVAAIGIGPVHKRHVIGASIQMEKDGKYGVMLAFDVTIDRDAELMAQEKGLKLFSSNIIYHLFDMFKKHTEDYKNQLREKHKHLAVFPSRLRILPDCIFNSRDPIVVGVVVEDGVLKQGTPLSVPAKGIDIGVVQSIEINHVTVDKATRGQEVCIKIDPAGGDKKMLGRHFEVTDPLFSKISRETIDVCKNYFRDDLTKEDWRLMKQLKEEVFKFI